jgi:probable phosphoglycerate mutase
MTELLLIRHGLPVAGIVDPGLSPEGARQAELLAGWLADEKIDALYTSPYRRAAETAAPTERLLGLSAAVEPDLREWDHDVPVKVYTPPEQLPAEHPQAIALAEGRFDDFVPELDLAAFQARAVAVMTRLLDAHPGGRIAAFTHGGLTNAYLALVIGMPRVFWFHPGYTSISRVERLPSGVVVVTSVNETAHLRPPVRA